MLGFYVALVLGFSCLVDLPAELLAGVSLLAGWPGVVLMIAVVPPVVRLAAGPRPLDAPAPTAPGATGPEDPAR